MNHAQKRLSDAIIKAIQECNGKPGEPAPTLNPATGRPWNFASKLSHEDYMLSLQNLAFTQQLVKSL